MGTTFSFSDDDAEPGRPHARFGPPENEVPGSVSVEALIGRSDECAVALLAVRVFSDGIELELGARVRRRDSGQFSPLTEEVRGGQRYGDPNRALLFGVLFADGRWTTNLDHGGPHQAELGRPTLTPGSGGGGELNADNRFWLSPLPPVGDLTVICAWPSRGVGETRTVIDADEIAAARSRVVELWPWEPPPPEPVEPRIRFQPPAGTWFAEVLGDQPAS